MRYIVQCRVWSPLCYCSVINNNQLVLRSHDARPAPGCWLTSPLSSPLAHHSKITPRPLTRVTAPSSYLAPSHTADPSEQIVPRSSILGGNILWNERSSLTQVCSGQNYHKQPEQITNICFITRSQMCAGLFTRSVIPSSSFIRRRYLEKSTHGTPAATDSSVSAPPRVCVAVAVRTGQNLSCKRSIGFHNHGKGP